MCSSRDLLWAIFSALGVVLLPAVVGMDLFTSPHELVALVHKENRLLHALHGYITKQQAKLTLLVEKYERLLRANPQDQEPEKYLEDPVTVFLMIRRLAREWPLVLHLMSEHVDVGLPSDILELPTESDVQSAFRGLARLQEVYRIDTELLASGSVDGTSSDYRPNITALVCYEIGKYWYSQMEFRFAWTWFHQALMKISHGDSTVQRQLVMTHMYLAISFSGCQMNMATSPTNRLMQLTLRDYPDMALSGEMSADFRQALANNCSWVMDTKRELMGTEYIMSETLKIMYSEMCLGPGETPEGLKCYYIHYNNPRLLLAPFKMEEVHIDPPVLMFHDVISDQEIRDMKTAFFNVMSECETLNEHKKVSRSQYRKCHVGWVEDKYSNTSARLTRRIADISNLNLDTSEINQVANYGLGGEFQLHGDAIENTSLSEDRPQGDRIATVMLYLNDVASGGRTIFPHIRVSVTPKKGSAIFWFNLDSYSREIPSMLHGGCPVLRGSKWVINKWIHEGGQNFQTTCPSNGIFPQKYFYLNNKIKNII